MSGFTFSSLCTVWISSVTVCHVTSLLDKQYWWGVCSPHSENTFHPCSFFPSSIISGWGQSGFIFSEWLKRFRMLCPCCLQISKGLTLTSCEAGVRPLLFTSMWHFTWDGSYIIVNTSFPSTQLPGSTQSDISNKFKVHWPLYIIAGALTHQHCFLYIENALIDNPYCALSVQLTGSQLNVLQHFSFTFILSNSS